MDVVIVGYDDYCCFAEGAEAVDVDVVCVNVMDFSGGDAFCGVGVGSDLVDWGDVDAFWDCLDMDIYC